MHKKDNKLRILHIINSVEGGGAEYIVNSWVKSKYKYQIHVLSLVELPRKFENNPFYSTLGYRSAYNITAVFKVAKYIKRYDIVHVHLFPAQLYVSILSLFFQRVMFITTEHSTHNRRRDNPLFRVLDKFIYSRYIKVVGISPAVTEALHSYLAIKNLYTINNGVDLVAIKSAVALPREALGFGEDCYIVCMVASFSKAKDQMTLIKAISCLDDKIKLILVGKGEKEEQYRNYVAVNGLANKVKFLGYRSDVYSIIKAVDLVVQSSFWEGFGLSVVEAMVCEKPVLVSDVSGMSEVVANNELVFPVGDSSLLAAKIIGISVIAKNNRALINYLVERTKQYDVSLMISQYEALYERL